MKNFFQREKTSNYEKSFLPLIRRQLNLKNLNEIKKAKVLNLYDSKYEKDFLAYRFYLLTEWMEENKEYSKQYVVALDDMIDKLYLSNELNSFEQQYIKNIKSVVFAMTRNLKQLIVDFPINKGEFVFYRYDLDVFKLISSNHSVQNIFTPDMYITTQRILISKHIDTISIYFKDMESYQYTRARLSLILKNGNQCIIDSENNRAIMESLKRVLKREKIEFK